MVITKNMALEIARKKVDELALATGDQFEIILDETKAVDKGWIFFYNTADYVRTRNPIHALAGNGPIMVSRDGVIHELPTAVPWEEALKKI